MWSVSLESLDALRKSLNAAVNNMAFAHFFFRVMAAARTAIQQRATAKGIAITCMEDVEKTLKDDRDLQAVVTALTKYWHEPDVDDPLRNGQRCTGKGQAYQANKKLAHIMGELGVHLLRVGDHHDWPEVRAPLIHCKASCAYLEMLTLTHAACSENGVCTVPAAHLMQRGGGGSHCDGRAAGVCRVCCDRPLLRYA